MAGKLYPFNILALGTRFQYQGTYTMWVKIGTNLIAKWKEEYKTDRWIGQAVCSFAETEKGCDGEVFVL